MVNKPKALGTKAESAVVEVLKANGFPYAERRALKGSLDQGDVAGTIGLCWEVKGGKTAWYASDGLIAEWMAETEAERINARADIGVLVVQRKGIGPANAHRWWALMPANAWILGARKHGFPVRLLLSDACTLLRAAGYGDPLQSAEVGG